MRSSSAQPSTRQRREDRSEVIPVRLVTFTALLTHAHACVVPSRLSCPRTRARTGTGACARLSSSSVEP
jgi:hypothetical protein